MNKIIRSQDGRQMYYLPTASQCYFSIAPTEADSAKEQKNVFFSVGINNVSFGVFKKIEKAEEALSELENFLLDKAMRFQLPADK